MTNKVVYVAAHWAPVGKYKAVSVPTGEKRAGWFGGEKNVTRKEQRFIQTGISDCDVDTERLAEDVANAVAGLNAAGYEVVTIAPLISGAYHAEAKWGWTGNGGVGYGYGYSFTKGVVITARLSRPLQTNAETRKEV
jgi:hypothetical protein